MPGTILKQKTGRPSKRQLTAKRILSKKPTIDAVKILNSRYGNPDSDAFMEEELERVLIGNQIYELRTNAGMTQAALAKKIGTGASAICRLEDADYESHSLPILRKIAAVFNTRLQIKFVPIKEGKTQKKSSSKSSDKPKSKKTLS